MKVSKNRFLKYLVCLIFSFTAPLTYGSTTVTGNFPLIPNSGAMIRGSDIRVVFSVTLDGGADLDIDANPPASGSYQTSGSAGQTAISGWELDIQKQGVSIYSATSISSGAIMARAATFSSTLIAGNYRHSMNFVLNTFGDNGIIPDYNDGITAVPVTLISFEFLNFVPQLPPAQPTSFTGMLNNRDSISDFRIDEILASPNSYQYGSVNLLNANNEIIGNFAAINPVPEPSVSALVVVFMLGVLRRRR